jgi:hypothetical protein
MRKQGAQDFVRHALDTHTLLTRAFAGHDRNRAFGDTEGVCKNVDQLGVSGAIDRSGMESNDERVAAHAGNT